MSLPNSDVPPAVEVEGFRLAPGLPYDHANARAIVRFERAESGGLKAVIEPVPRDQPRSGYQPDGSVLIMLGS